MCWIGAIKKQPLTTFNVLLWIIESWLFKTGFFIPNKGNFIRPAEKMDSTRMWKANKIKWRCVKIKKKMPELAKMLVFQHCFVSTGYLILSLDRNRAEGFEVNTRLLRLIDPDVVGVVVHKILWDSHQWKMVEGTGEDEHNRKLSVVQIKSKAREWMNLSFALIVSSWSLICVGRIYDDAATHY